MKINQRGEICKELEMDIERKVHVQKFHVAQNRKIHEKQISLNDHCIIPQFGHEFHLTQKLSLVITILGKMVLKAFIYNILKA